MRQTRWRERLLLATDPDIVRDIPKRRISAVDAENGAKLVLEVVTATRLKTDTVKIEPGSPEESGEKLMWRFKKPPV